MKSESKIQITCDNEQEVLAIEALFASEDKELSNKRGSYTWVSVGTSIEFTIVANDLVALRAILASVTKVLGLYGKVKQQINCDV